MKILHRLKTHGHIAYLVGGSVRDLLLGIAPKDFDVGTSAHPQEIKKLFRNCRLIGRRFRLAHLLFRDRIIEVATFRDQAVPMQEEILDLQPAHEATFEEPMRDLLITRDNTFGTPETDAFRRDFTVNGLFYDIATFAVVDYVGGIKDLRAKLIRCIGDPDIRFREDPVRMLRAIKFAGRLGFRIEQDTYRGILIHQGEIVKAAPPRLIEEVSRLLQGGASADAFRMLHETGLLAHVLPRVASWLKKLGLPFSDTPLALRLKTMDSLKAEGEHVSPAVAFGALLAPGVQNALEKQRVSRFTGGFGSPPEMSAALEEALDPLLLPRRERDRILQIYVAQRRFYPGKRMKPQALLHHPHFPEFFQFFRLTAKAEGKDLDLVKQWQTRVKGTGLEKVTTPAPAPRRRRKRRWKGKPKQRTADHSPGKNHP